MLKESGAGRGPERAVEDLGGVSCVRSRWSAGSPPGFRAARCARCAAPGGSAPCTVTAATRCAARPTSCPPSPAPRSAPWAPPSAPPAPVAPTPTSRSSTPASRRSARCRAAWSTVPTSPTTRASTSCAASTPSATARTWPASSPPSRRSAQIVNVKVADSDGSTSLGRLLAGIDWVARNGDRRGLDVRVLNLAFGAESNGSYRDDPLAYAAERAWQRGLVVVASAGNGGAEADGLDSPAHDPYLVAVGALDTGGTATLADDGVATFSSRGSADPRPRRRRPRHRDRLRARPRLLPRRGLPGRAPRRRLPRLRHLAGRRGGLRRRRRA